MCRNIKTLFNFDPPVTAEEIRAASVQFVRKISGFSKPSKATEGAFQVAVDEIARISTQLLCGARNKCSTQESTRGGDKGEGSCRATIWYSSLTPNAPRMDSTELRKGRSQV
jgi:hypothetical protein